MGIHGLHLSCLAFFLLLFLLPPPISKAKSLHYHGPGSKLFHLLGKGSRSFQQHQFQQMMQNWSQDKGQVSEDCLGIFDLYIILDKSCSVGINWIHVYSFAEDLLKKFQNPKMRISVITFSTEAEVIIPLTSDRETIQKGLLTLLEEVPEGFKHMQKGIQKAIEQITKANLEGSNVNSVIIALTDGTLMDKPFKQTVEEAKKARELGATIFTVGVHMYDKIQMMDIADSPSHSLGVQEGFSALQSIIDTLAAKTCIEVLSIQPSHVCIKGAYQVNIRGRGFSNAKDMNQVICRFTFSDSGTVDESPTDMNDKSISCPGPRILHAGEEVSLQVSLNSGISFIGNKLIVTGTNCGSARGIAVGSSSDRSSSSSSSSSNPKPNQLQEEDLDPADTSQGKIATVRSKPPRCSPLFNWKFLIFIPVLLMSLLLLCCSWKLCCGKRKEQLPPPDPEKDPEENLSPPPSSPPSPPIPPSSPSPVNPNHPVTIVSCGCGNRGIQGNPDPCCSCFQPGCYQTPLEWYHLTVQGRCTKFTVANPSCTHASCSPELCPPSNRDCLHLMKDSYSSRIVLQPSKEYFGNSQASCSPEISLQAGQECLPVAPSCSPEISLQAGQECLPVAPTLCSKLCPPNQKCNTLDCS